MSWKCYRCGTENGCTCRDCITLIHGDCRDVLPKLPPVDLVLTDPPYELGFMGNGWDKSGIAYDVGVWHECLRVLKPGGHLLAFGGSRTYHRLASAVEDAGFEIRDQIMWLYGQGFPKSLDVSKAIDKAAGVLRTEVIGIKKNTYDGANRDPAKHSNPAAQSNIGKWGLTQTPHGLPLTAPATDKSREWQGWGTALKPAHEPLVLARKPLSGTVVANVLKHGTGGLNIDGCRVPLNGDYKSKANGRPSQTGLPDNYDPEKANQPDTVGRWPANVIHDGSEEVLEQFPDAAGQLAPSVEDGADQGNKVYGKMKRGGPHHIPRVEQTTSAARFFYCAKANKNDRGEGNAHPTVKPTELMRYLCRLITPPGGTVLDPFAGSGTTLVAAKQLNRKAIGIEICEDYCRIAAKRLEQSVFQFTD